MAKFNEEDRICHHRKGDPLSFPSYGLLLKYEGTRAVVRFEHSGKENGVESRDLLTEEEAEKAGVS
jgi:hypothetical protein